MMSVMMPTLPISDAIAVITAPYKNSVIQLPPLEPITVHDGA
jgi:hypothetical protein